MKITIPQPALNKALRFAIEATGKRETIPVLNYGLIETLGDTALRITCTDLDVTVKSETDANIEKQGAVCAHARKLAEVVGRLPNAPITLIREDNGWLKLTCLKSSYRIPGAAQENFPQIPAFAVTATPIPSNDLIFLLKSTRHSITTELSRFALAAIKFECKDGIKAIATDGNQLGIASINIQAELEDFLLPSSAISAVLQLAEDSDSLLIGADENHIYLKGEDGSIIARKLTGQFPNWQMVVPKNNDKVLIANTGELLTATERLMSVADLAVNGNRNRRIYLHLGANELRLTAQSAEIGGGEEVVSAEYSGAELKIAIWAHNLLTGLKPYPAADQIKLTFKNEDSQMTVEPVEAQNGRSNMHIMQPLGGDRVPRRAS